MFIKKITILIGLILCINHIVAQNIYEQELIKGIQAIFQANFEEGIPLLEKNINNKTIDKEGKSIASIALQLAYKITDNKSFNIITLKKELRNYKRKDRLYAIVKLGSDLGLYLFATCDAYELTSLINRGETVSLAMTKGKYSVMLGGCVNDHGSISCKESLSQKNAMLKECEGYLVNNGKCICFKAMNSVEEVTK